MAGQPGFVFLTHPGPDDVDLPPRTVVAETAAAFASLDARLRAHGLDFSHVVKTRLWYSEIGDFPAMNSLRVPFYAGTFTAESWPASSGFVTGGRGGTAPRFEIEVVAHPGQHGRSTDAAIRQWGEVRPPYAHANSAGDVVFLSGQGGYTPAGDLVAPGGAAQAYAAIGALRRVLAAEGLTPADVLSLTVFTAPPAVTERDGIATAVAEFLTRAGEGPLVAWVEARELSFPGMIVEIELTALRPGTATVRRAATPHGAALAAGGIALATAVTDAAALAEALREVDSAVRGLGGTGDGLLSVWFSPEHDRADLLGLLRGVLAPGTALSLLPMGSGTDRVVLEFVGSATG